MLSHCFRTCSLNHQSNPSLLGVALLFRALWLGAYRCLLLQACTTHLHILQTSLSVTPTPPFWLHPHHPRINSPAHLSRARSHTILFWPKKGHIDIAPHHTGTNVDPCEALCMGVYIPSVSPSPISALLTSLHHLPSRPRSHHSYHHTW